MAVNRSKIMKYYEVKIKAERTNEEGQAKKCAQLFLVDAVSFTEAEAITVKNEGYTGDFEILAIKKARYSEVIRDEEGEEVSGNKFFRVKADFTTILNNGKESKESFLYLVEAMTIEQATKKFKEYVRGSVNDYDVSGVSETKILDIY